MPKFEDIDNYDYIVIGAGTSGSVVASRLSEDPSKRVLVLEAGGKDISPWFHIPIGYYKTVGNPRYDWGYSSTPEKQLNNREMFVPRAKVVGGCAAINGLVYVRGQHADYDRWEELGNPGWAWRHVEPYFKRFENHEHGSNAFGKNGPLGLTKVSEQREISKAFVEAATDQGLPLCDDFDGRPQEGFTYTLSTIQKGLRSSTSVKYLKPALKRPNLNLITRASCERIRFEGRRATGVEFKRYGKSYFAKARKEVILSGGAINSPQILQLSGVGSPETLKPLGIDIVEPLAGVGLNLQDHFTLETKYRLKAPITLNDNLRNPFWKIDAGLKWLVKREGPLNLCVAHLIGFAKSSPSEQWPDIQFHFLPITLDEDRQPHPFPGVSLDVYPVRPESRGTVKIKSKNPDEKPVINFNFLSTNKDVQKAVAALKLCRNITQRPAFRKYVEAEFAPGPQVNTDDEFLAFAREVGCTDYHPVGTCKMGSDKNAVVDHRLRVKGLSSLRVIDCSIMPEIISGNTNGCAIMIAEKGAGMIIEDSLR